MRRNATLAICLLTMAVSLSLNGCRALMDRLPAGSRIERGGRSYLDNSGMPFASAPKPEGHSATEVQNVSYVAAATPLQANAANGSQPHTIVRGQDPASGGFRSEVTFQKPVVQDGQVQNAGYYQQGYVPTQQQKQNNDVIVDNSVEPTAYQYPELQTTTPANPVQYPSAQIGSPNEMYPGFRPNAPSGVGTFPNSYLDQNYADLQINVSEGRTGQVRLGGAYNSDSGLVGQFSIDERNFDIRRFPRSFRDITDGVAWRGGGQGFRLELMPGNQVQRYMVDFTEPYFLDTNVSLSLSAFLFDRNYFDWSEQRLGGRIGLGYRLSQDLSISVGLRMEDVDVYDPRVNTSTELNNSLGSTDLFLGQVSLVNDTRDNLFQPTTGKYMSLGLSQAFGEVSFPRADLEYRTYRLLYERADGSGRHTLSHSTKLGFSGSDTPIFENYFAGGFSTMRGFSFRGVGPLETGVRVGGEFQWLNTLEYMFPLTADDMIRGVVFVDYGTIEEDVRIDWDNFRVAPGFGFRVSMPAAGIGAPLAFDFAFPVSRAAGDDLQMFSFYMGLSR
ncbi:MAG: BamA/TamA family outer membrane protein [Pirellulaceae bacterium]